MRNNVKLKIENGKWKQLSVVSGRWSVGGVLFLLATVHWPLTTASAQTGGTFDLSHAVIAGGGGADSTGTGGGRTFRVDGTIGQPAAGVSSNSSPARFDLHGGFWFQNLAPTAAQVAITGRVTTASGNGLRNARLTLTAPDGARRTAITSTFGYYAFDGVEVGHTYVLEIASKRYTFANPTRIFSLQDEVTDMDFVAESQ